MSTRPGLRRRKPADGPEPWIPGHAIDLTIDLVGIRAAVDCLQGPGGPCRLTCPDCEDLCVCSQDWVDAGRCFAAEDLNAADQALDLYEDHPRPLASGPIEVRFAGSDQGWRWRFSTERSDRKDRGGALSKPGVVDSPCGPVRTEAR